MYRIGDSNNNSLVYATFDEAVKVNPDAHPLFHSDRGFQYTSKGFHDKLIAANMRQSMSRGLCSDFSVNAYPHGKTVHILRSSEPEAEAEPPPMAARSVLDRLA